MRLIIIFSLIILTGCSTNLIPANLAPSTNVPLAFATATLLPTFTPRPSMTFTPPTIAPTVAPILANLKTQVNVRAKPDISAEVLGVISYGTRVQIIGKDPGSTWFQIIYPENSASYGWVNAAYVQVSEGDAKGIPVAQVDPSRLSTPSSADSLQSPPVNITATLPAERNGRVTKQIFVRVGPGQTFATLGTVNSGTTVILLGRNQNNVWIQIKFEAAANGKGWVAAAFLEGADLAGLPFFDNAGNQISEAVPVIISGKEILTPTAFSPAPVDGDSVQKPAVRIKFSPDGSREFTFSSELSSPSGDTEDYVAFTPYEATNQSTYLYFRLDCIGNGGITATLEKDGLPISDVKPIFCGNYDVVIKVLGGVEYTLLLKADGSGGPLRYVSYTLKVNSLR